MIVLALLAILIVTVVVKHILQRRHWESYVKHLKVSAPLHPVFGNALEFIGKTPKQIFKELVENIKIIDTPHKSYFGPFLIITLDRPEDFKSALMSQHCLDKPYMYAFYPSNVSIMSATCKFILRGKVTMFRKPPHFCLLFFIEIIFNVSLESNVDPQKMCWLMTRKYFVFLLGWSLYECSMNTIHWTLISRHVKNVKRLELFKSKSQFLNWRKYENKATKKHVWEKRQSKNEYEKWKKIKQSERDRSKICKTKTTAINYSKLIIYLCSKLFTQNRKCGKHDGYFLNLKCMTFMKRWIWK